jgi:hypothetical protein
MSPTARSAVSGPCRQRVGTTAWSVALELASTGYLGANGLKVHGDAVWVSNTDKGTVVRIPVLPDGASGPPRIWAGGLPTIDDFAFTGNEILAAVNHTNTVVRIRQDGTETTVLRTSRTPTRTSCAPRYESCADDRLRRCMDRASTVDLTGVALIWSDASCGFGGPWWL